MRCVVQLLTSVIFFGSPCLLYVEGSLSKELFKQYHGKKLHSVFETYQGLSKIKCARTCQSRIESHACSGANYNKQSGECSLSNSNNQTMTDEASGHVVALKLIPADLSIPSPGLSCPLSVAMGCTQDGSTSVEVHGRIRNVTMCQCTGSLGNVGGCRTDVITITPALYVDLIDYYWYIEAPPGQTISITFSEVDIENDAACSFDSVEVYDGPTNTSTLAIKFCSTTIPATITTTGNQMLVRFETDRAYERTGFKSTVCFISV